MLEKRLGVLAGIFLIGVLALASVAGSPPSAASAPGGTSGGSSDSTGQVPGAMQSAARAIQALASGASGLATTAAHALSALGASSAADPAAVSPAGGPVSYGADGRLTILLIGSDWRKHLYGERTDVIMVVTIDPATKRVATASIPRDTIYFPRAKANGGGTTKTNRVNAIYLLYYRHTNLAHGKVDLGALVKFKKDVAAALQTEIDYVAMIRFTGFTQLVNAIGGINVQIADAIRDSFLRTSGHGKRGVYFPKSSSWHLTGNPPCTPYPAKCHNSLAYARSRHGWVGSSYNSDFARARRQQGMVVAGTDQIVSNGQSSLSSLLTYAKSRVYTDLPETLAAATQLYSLVNGAHLAHGDQVVFSPNKWAVQRQRDPIYTFELRLPQVRAWINNHFGS